MLDKARASIAQSLKTTETKFQFIQGSAEDLSQTTTLQPESVDLITAGTYVSLLKLKSYFIFFNSTVCSLVRLEQSLATNSSCTTSRRYRCLLGNKFLSMNQNPTLIDLLKGLCRISTLKSPHFDSFDLGICTRKQHTHKPWSTFPTTWKNHIRTSPCRCSGTFNNLER